MGKGGESVLVIPSGAAYGPSGTINWSIPHNTVLRFDVSLIDIIE